MTNRKKSSILLGLAVASAVVSLWVPFMLLVAVLLIISQVGYESRDYTDRMLAKHTSAPPTLDFPMNLEKEPR